MNLSLYTGTAPKPYLEYGWVCAPNTAAQSITSNTITTLTIDTEVADTGNFGSIASNQITLAAGTYYAKAKTGNTYVSGGYVFGAVLALYNITSGIYVSRNEFANGLGGVALEANLETQFTISGTTVFDLRLHYSENANRVLSVGGSNYTGNFSLATAGADQRTTIKLWKLA